MIEYTYFCRCDRCGAEKLLTPVYRRSEFEENRHRLPWSKTEDLADTEHVAIRIEGFDDIRATLKISERERASFVCGRGRLHESGGHIAKL